MAEKNNHTGEAKAVEKKADLTEFNSSFRFDRRLFRADISVNLAYCRALFGAGILTRPESEKIKNGLETMLKRSEFDGNYFDDCRSSDIHSFIDDRLVRLIGDTGRKLQTGKCRTDQTATTLRIWLRTEIEELIGRSVPDLQKALIRSAESSEEIVFPGHSDLKFAQPIIWAHWCLAFFEMFSRDTDRLDEVWRRVNILTLGSGEGAGIGFEIDREDLARNLGFEGISLNSLDGISDRDFAVEFLNAASLVMVHLSRLAEDLTVYSGDKFGFVLFNRSGEDSSVELRGALGRLRTKPGRVFGHQTALLATLKGMPTGSNRDLREDQEALFDTVDTLRSCLDAARTIVSEITLCGAANDRAVRNYFDPGELTDYLINRGLPFAAATMAAKELVNFLRVEDKSFENLSIDELRRFSVEFEEDVFSEMKVRKIVASKNQIGGTAPERVSEALESARKRFSNVIE